MKKQDLSSCDNRAARLPITTCSLAGNQVSNQSVVLIFGNQLCLCQPCDPPNLLGRVHMTKPQEQRRLVPVTIRSLQKGFKEQVDVAMASVNK
jgi:hypothetical protein